MNKTKFPSLCKTSIQIINQPSNNVKDLTSNTSYRYTCSLPGSLSLGLTHLIQLPLLLISSLNTVVYKDDSSQAPRLEYKHHNLNPNNEDVCVHRMTDYRSDDRLRKRCPNENIQKNQKWVPWGLQININVVSYCLTLHENEFCSFNILHRYAWRIWYLILHMKKKIYWI